MRRLAGPSPAFPLSSSEALTLPLVSIKGVALSPGEALPIYLNDEIEGTFEVEAALRAQAPSRRLVVVLWADASAATIGCIAELVARSAPTGHRFAVLALGRQRCRVVERARGARYARVAVLPLLDDAPPVPREARSGAAAWLPRVWQSADSRGLAARARAAAAELVPRRGAPPAGASELSFWLLSALPIPADGRQRLLAEPNAVARLAATLRLLPVLKTIVCLTCSEVLGEFEEPKLPPTLARCAPPDAVHFANRGQSFEVVATRPLPGVRDDLDPGEAPALRLTWVPGWKWAPTECRTCGEAMGWSFYPAEPAPGDEPFLLLRRDGLLSYEPEADAAAGDEA
jgi:Lon protease-like protein